MFQIEEEWKVNYYTEFEIAQKFGVEYDWMEEHVRNGKYQFTITKDPDEEGEYYSLIVSNEHMRKWADENHQRFKSLSQNPLNAKFYRTSNLGVLMEFVEEMKADAL